jgi:hypothetical protein
MGGASAQVAFVPDHDVIADFFPLRLPGPLARGGGRGDEVGLYAHSYLGFGWNEAGRRMARRIVETTRDEVEPFAHPCLPRGWRGTRFGARFMGTSDPDGCAKLARSLFGAGRASRTICFVHSCSFDGVYQPRLLDSPFIAIDALAKARVSLGLRPDATLDEWAGRADALCALDLSALESAARRRARVTKEASLSRGRSRAPVRESDGHVPEPEGLFGLPAAGCSDPWELAGEQASEKAQKRRGSQQGAAALSPAEAAAAGACGERAEDLCYRAQYFHAFLSHGLGFPGDERRIAFLARVGRRGDVPSVSWGFALQTVSTMPWELVRHGGDRDALLFAVVGCVVFAALWVREKSRPSGGRSSVAPVTATA